MAKTQLYLRHKDMLVRFANRSVKAPAEEQEMKRLYAELAPIVKDIVETKYPPKDMKVLKKYNASSQDQCIRLRGDDGVTHEFNFVLPEDRGPLRDEALAYLPYVANSSGGCYSRFYLCDRVTSQLVQDYQNALNDFSKAIDKKLAAYKALIQNSRYYEEVLEIWPAAEACREDIMSDRNAISVLSAEVIAAIRSDNAGSEAA